MYDVSEFEPELQFIKNEAIREFTRVCLENAPPYFWEVPASSGGKYHPVWASGDGGLVRHSRVTAFVTKELAQAFKLDPDETDAAISAAIMHDVTKHGLPGGKYSVKDHDYIAACFIHRQAKQFTAVGNPEVPMLREICGAVAYHFGNFSVEVVGRKLKTFPEEYSKIEQIIHTADMVASRKGINFDFLQMQETLIA